MESLIIVLLAGIILGMMIYGQQHEVPYQGMGPVTTRRNSIPVIVAIMLLILVSWLMLKPPSNGKESSSYDESERGIEQVKEESYYDD